MSENYEEAKPKNFKFGKVGDFIKGTLLSVNKTSSPDAYGKLSMIYKVKTKEGSFIGSTKDEKTGSWSLNEEPTVITEGEEYVVFISEDKGIIIGAMSDVKIGQKFMMKFTELKPTTKGHDAKIIKVFKGKNEDGTPLMDEKWLEENQGENMEQF